jgi:hypothetical protein
MHTTQRTHAALRRYRNHSGSLKPRRAAEPADELWGRPRGTESTVREVLPNPLRRAESAVYNPEVFLAVLLPSSHQLTMGNGAFHCPFDVP